jgi:hypothetical protein
VSPSDRERRRHRAARESDAAFGGAVARQFRARKGRLSPAVALARRWDESTCGHDGRLRIQGVGRRNLANDKRTLWRTAAEPE